MNKLQIHGPTDKFIDEDGSKRKGDEEKDDDLQADTVETGSQDNV